jgi:hypothetical protein
MELKRYLFIGNSFTFVNNLPDTFAGLANAAGYNVAAYFSGIGAATFYSLSKSISIPIFLQLYKWDGFIMQEQSMFLSQPLFFIRQNSSPYAKVLYNQAKQHSKTVLLYQTWGYQHGNPSFLTGLNDTYNKMQARLVGGYADTQQQLLTQRNESAGDANVIISRVGEAWNIAQRNPMLRKKLWQTDGMHPRPVGTYLAACVFYTSIFGESPVGNAYRIKGVSRKDALALQKIARDMIMPV